MTRALGVQSYHLFRVNILIYTVRLFTGALTARALGVKAMGVWIVLSMLPSYAEAFGRLKFDVAAVYLLGQKKYRIGEMCFTLNLLAAVLSGIFVLALILFRAPIAAGLFRGQVVDLTWYYLVLLLIPLNFFGMNYAYMLLHLERTQAFNRQNLIKNVGSGLLSVALIYGLGWRVGAVVAAVVVGSATGTIYACIMVHRDHPLKPTLDGVMMRELVVFGAPMYVAGIVEFLNQYLSGLIVALYMGPAEVAFFRMGQDRLQVLDYLPGSLNTALYPRLTKSDDAAERVRLVCQACRIALLLMVGAGLLGALLAWPVVLVLYGAQFLPMVTSVWLLLPGMIVAGSTAPISQFFFGTGRPSIPLYVSLCSLILQVGLAMLLIPRMGFRGAALAMSIGLLLQASLRLTLFARYGGTRVIDAAVPRGSDVSLVFRFGRDRVREVLRTIVPGGSTEST